MDPEAETGTPDTFAAKLRALVAVGDPIKTRVYEASRRPERIKGAKLLIDLVRKAEKDWPKAKPWLNATHVAHLGSLVRCLASIARRRAPDALGLLASSMREFKQRAA